MRLCIAFVIPTTEEEMMYGMTMDPKTTPIAPDEAL